MIIQKIFRNLLRTMKAARTSLRNSIFRTQIVQNQRIYHPGGKEIS